MTLGPCNHGDLRQLILQRRSRIRPGKDTVLLETEFQLIPASEIWSLPRGAHFRAAKCTPERGWCSGREHALPPQPAELIFVCTSIGPKPRIRGTRSWLSRVPSSGSRQGGLSQGLDPALPLPVCMPFEQVTSLLSSSVYLENSNNFPTWLFLPAAYYSTHGCGVAVSATEEASHLLLTEHPHSNYSVLGHWVRAARISPEFTPGSGISGLKRTHM